MAGVVYPSARDPRWFQLAFLCSFVAYALSSPGFSRTPMQWVAGVSVCVTLDFALTRAIRGTTIVPVSGLISSMGLLLLCDSPDLWPYPACGAIAMLSKHLIRLRGKHIFNPLNFGIVCGLLFFGGEMTVVPGRWGGGVWGMAAIAALGMVVVWRAHRLDVSLTYVATFVVGAGVRSFLSGGRIVTVVGPITGAAFALFTFFMISDPMTTPETRAGRIVYAIALGSLDAALRYKQITHAPMYALFVMCGFLPIFRRVFVPKQPEQVWQPAVWKPSG